MEQFSFVCESRPLLQMIFHIICNKYFQFVFPLQLSFHLGQHGNRDGEFVRNDNGLKISVRKILVSEEKTNK